MPILAWDCSPDAEVVVPVTIACSAVPVVLPLWVVLDVFDPVELPF